MDGAGGEREREEAVLSRKVGQADELFHGVAAPDAEIGGGKIAARGEAQGLAGFRALGLDDDAVVVHGRF